MVGAEMSFYVLTAVKFALGMLVMILQINILGKYEFSLNTPLNQIQNYVLGGIIGGVIYNQSITVLQFLIILLTWSLVVIVVKVLAESSKVFRKVIASRPELIVSAGQLDVSRCAKVGLTAEQLSRRLREEDIAGIRDVEAAIMETNGKLTVRTHDTQSRGSLLPLITDGRLVEDGLRLAGRDGTWIDRQLKKQGYSSAKQVFLGEFVDGELEVVPFPHNPPRAASKRAPR